MTGTAPYEELAHAILNTYGPHARFHALCERFPKIGRHDVFFGISLAWAIADADTVHADREIRILRQRIEQLEQQLAPLEHREAA